jgi:hypothetical protein
MFDKYILALGLILAAATVFGGCGGAAPAAPAPHAAAFARTTARR